MKKQIVNKASILEDLNLRAEFKMVERLFPNGLDDSTMSMPRIEAELYADIYHSETNEQETVLMATLSATYIDAERALEAGEDLFWFMDSISHDMYLTHSAFYDGDELKGKLDKHGHGLISQNMIMI